MTSTMFQRLGDLERRYDELAQLMSDPEIANDSDKLIEYSRERAELDSIVLAFRELREVDNQIQDAEALRRQFDLEEE